MDGQIKFDSVHDAEVRIIGKTNVVLSIKKDGEFVAQMNMRKVKNQWSLKVKKCAAGYHAESKGWRKAKTTGTVVTNLEKFLADHYVEKILLT